MSIVKRTKGFVGPTHSTTYVGICAKKEPIQAQKTLNFYVHPLGDDEGEEMTDISKSTTSNTHMSAAIVQDSRLIYISNEATFLRLFAAMVFGDNDDDDMGIRHCLDWIVERVIFMPLLPIPTHTHTDMSLGKPYLPSQILTPTLCVLI